MFQVVDGLSKNADPPPTHLDSMFQVRYGGGNGNSRCCREGGGGLRCFVVLEPRRFWPRSVLAALPLRYSLGVEPY